MTRSSTPPRVVVIGPLPPPVHGYSAATAFVVAQLRLVAPVDAIDVSPDSLIRDWRYHGQRLWRAARAFATLLRRASGGRSLYFPIAGGAGVIYDLPLAATARALGYRIFIHHHSFAYINRRNRLSAVLFALCGRTTTHICLSSGMARRLSDLYAGIGRTAVLSNAALVEPSSPPCAKHGPIRIGFLSNLIPEKGLDTAFAVLRSLRDEGIKSVFLVAGPVVEAEMQNLLDRIRSELGDDFRYCGALYGAEKAAFFRDLDVFLFPTRYTNEAQPIVVLEALAAGVPVLATGRGAIADDVIPAGGAIYTDDEYISQATRKIGAWSKDRAGLAMLSLGTFECASKAHAVALADLATLIREMTEPRQEALAG
jgi:glycosyltransferase involved in cell wall biosynthesis